MNIKYLSLGLGIVCLIVNCLNLYLLNERYLDKDRNASNAIKQYQFEKTEWVKIGESKSYTFTFMDSVGTKFFVSTFRKPSFEQRMILNSCLAKKQK